VSFNPSPSVALARDIAQNLGKDQVIIITLDAAGRVGYISYGKTKSLCEYAKRLADVAFDAIRKVY